VEGWHDILRSISRTGVRAHLTSNFARPFSEEELDAMLDLASAVVSLDTDDPELLRVTRRSVRLPTILDNLDRLRRAASRRGVRGPLLLASCVVHTHNVMHLDRFVRFCLARGIRGFDFCNLTKNPDLPGALNVAHVATLPPEQLSAAYWKLVEAKGIAYSRGASCEIQSGLLDSIATALKASDGHAWAALQSKRRYFAAPQDGETRRCLDPWFLALIQADGTVKPCCWHAPVGNLRDAPLTTIANGDPAVALRRQLAAGDLCESCRTCPARPGIGRGAFEAILRREVPSNRWSANLRRAGTSAKHCVLRHAPESLAGWWRAAAL
jgi:MoaA/NifB/PqqE/SkfB family radical SAM enzyme